MTLREDVLQALTLQPGLSDRELTNRLRGPGAAQQPINQECRSLETKGLIVRRQRADGRIGNYPVDQAASADVVASAKRGTSQDDVLAEDSLKQVLKQWLESDGWQVQVAWGRAPGADVVARRDGQVWIIEVKGRGSRPPMRVNYFLGILGETLQRMSDTTARYSIALPDLPQFRGLWDRLPKLAKERTMISALFVSEAGNVDPA